MFQDDPVVAKITDFGLARVKANNQTMTKCGTKAWIAPEVWTTTK
jgi:serine/threonine/tyrosine protein kinase RAD53